uniref:Putative secreted protein n=1 Tax=Ixodes ricinus TaxID=34613 RepID=A0A6B0UFX9_IXORI
MPSFWMTLRMAWRLVLCSLDLPPSPLNCMRFFIRSSGCTKSVAAILGRSRPLTRQSRRRGSGLVWGWSSGTELVVLTWSSLNRFQLGNRRRARNLPP